MTEITLEEPDLDTLGLTCFRSAVYQELRVKYARSWYSVGVDDSRDSVFYLGFVKITASIPHV